MSNVIRLDPSKKVNKSFLAVITYHLQDGSHTTTSVSLDATSTGQAIKKLMSMGILDGRKGQIQNVSFYLTNVSDFVRHGRLPPAEVSLDKATVEEFCKNKVLPAKVISL